MPTFRWETLTKSREIILIPGELVVIRCIRPRNLMLTAVQLPNGRRIGYHFRRLPGIRCPKDIISEDRPSFYSYARDGYNVTLPGDYWLVLMVESGHPTTAHIEVM